ncbi:MAG TPA: diaminopimelate epimerase [Chloroflexi bacterium]|jgi:diaminopimelate epimerase|nr:diaminopimelate epimerase [Chloroflexota bacterium]HAL25453.1 diaminopimelate epimerase [Chloroflexota bacterium]
MKFTKMHGCGNDFIVIDGPVEIDRARARALCDRRTGIGADGILVIGVPDGRRWPLVIHNADGSIADACGNGSRCVARYVLDREGGSGLELDTASGIVRAWRDPEGIGIELAAPQLGDVLRIDGRDARTVRVGNPNVMIFVDDPAREDLVALAVASTAVAGPANVGAVTPRGAGELALRVHERGVGETLACGTGSCAAVAAAIARGDVTSDTVRVRLPGGTLVVRPRGARYELAGPAEYVFTGES